MTATPVPPDVLNAVRRVYTDGGNVGPNPSKFGGTWAFVYTNAGDEFLWADSGVIRPADVGLPTVSNNVAELVAAVLALEQLRDGASVNLLSDSLNAIRRLTRPGVPDKNGYPPQAIIDRVVAVRSRITFGTVLLGGHPSKDELAAGVRRRGGYPVSRWNVLCDARCSAEAVNFRRSAE